MESGDVPETDGARADALPETEPLQIQGYHSIAVAIQIDDERVAPGPWSRDRDCIYLNKLALGMAVHKRRLAGPSAHYPPRDGATIPAQLL